MSVPFIAHPRPDARAMTTGLWRTPQGIDPACIEPTQRPRSARLADLWPWLAALCMVFAFGLALDTPAREDGCASPSAASSRRDDRATLAPVLANATPAVPGRAVARHPGAPIEAAPDPIEAVATRALDLPSACR